MTLRVDLVALPALLPGRWEILRRALVEWQVRGRAHLELAGVPIDIVTLATTPDSADLSGATLVVVEPALVAEFRRRLAADS